MRPLDSMNVMSFCIFHSKVTSLKHVTLKTRILNALLSVTRAWNVRLIDPALIQDPTLNENFAHLTWRSIESGTFFRLTLFQGNNVFVSKVGH
jgi:hypothetical protein